MSTRGQMIPMTMSDGHAVQVYHVEAKGHRRGGIVVVQEIFGITDHIKEMADDYADQGYEVHAPALFDREAPGFKATHEGEDLQQAIRIAREQHPFAVSIQDVQTCIDALRAHGPVCIVGYCYGGSVAWAAACRCAGLAAAAGYYGSLIPQFAQERPTCPVILHFGRLDPSIPMDGVERVRAEHPEVPVYIYDEAGHGFNSDRRRDYHPESAKLARERTLSLFAKACG